MMRPSDGWTSTQPWPWKDIWTDSPEPRPIRFFILKSVRIEVVTPEDLANAAPFYFVLRAFVADLKTERQLQGLSVAEIARRIEATAETLEQLESGALVNPSWQLLGRYASAVGRKLRLSLEH